jgi:8-oxo-dGTP diphosphatase
MGASEQGADKAAGRWLVSTRVLVLVWHDRHLLLMKRGPHRRIFPNRYNGLGGHVERNEDVESAVHREVMEESGLHLTDLRLCGIHNIDAGGDIGILMFVYTAQAATCDLTVTTDEGTLHWFPADALPFDEMVEDLPLILPRIQAMQPGQPPYHAHVSYDAADRIVIRYADPSHDSAD